MSELRVARDIMEPGSPEAPAVVVDAEVPLVQVLDFLAPTLYNQPELPGIAVREGDAVVGLIPRQQLLSLAADAAVRKSVEMAGMPLSRARYFVCRQCHYEELIIFYDPTQPPTCDKCKVLLIEGD